MSIFESLSQIQVELKVPKGRKNTFGNYTYRNAEDILETAKPICNKHGCLLTVFDEIVQIGDRFYVKATARLQDFAGESVFTTAFARESETKKGMDESQITGTASSYARKYALNGLFCIDDAKDADTYQKEQEASKKKLERQEKEKTAGIQRATSCAKNGCVNAVRNYCVLTGKQEREVWLELQKYCGGKYSKDFSIVDWNSSMNLVNGWTKEAQEK